MLLTGKKLNTSKTEKKARMSTLTTLINHSSGNSSHCNKTRKGSDSKGRNKTVLICRWLGKGIYKKIPRFKSEFSKVAECNDKHTKIILLYTNNEHKNTKIYSFLEKQNTYV